MFDKLKSFFSGVTHDAASQLPPVAPLKVKPGNRSWQAFFTSTRPSTATITRPERRLINTDTTTYRNGGTTHKVIQDMVAGSPELSNAVYTAVRLGVPEKYCAVARNMDGVLNPEATRLLQQLLTRFDVIGDPLEGYTGSGSIKSVSESLAGDLVRYGQASCELVLDKSRLPYRLQPFSSTLVKFKFDKNGVTPYQEVGGEEVSLDLPTVAIVQLDSDLLSPYSNSPIEPALKAALFSETFMADLHRVMRRAIHPRLMVSVDSEKVRKNLSPEAQMDPAKAVEELNAIIAQIETKVNGLAPEDALIYLDDLGFEVETPPASSDNYTILRDIANAKLASGSKTLPSVLGLESGSSSSNIASTEVALYIRNIDSSVRQKLNEIYSRLLTVAIRLMGVDCYVTFEYEAISIRPTIETIAFEQTRQMMILEKLSLGLITDDEASLLLTGKLPPAGYKPLSGTMFKDKAAQAPTPQGPSNDGSTLNQNLKPDTPDTGRGQNTKKKAEDETPEIEAQQPTFVTPEITVNIDNTQQSASVLRMKRDEEGNLIIERAHEQ